MSLASGTTLGHYEIGAHLGSGGMGEVYQARDTTLDRDVAIKILPEAFARDADRLARLEREAKVLASLNHQHIAAIYSLEAVGDLRLLVMELVPGRTLAEALEARPLPLEEALELAIQIASGLEAAHAKGIIHRDLKPANIKVTAEGRIKLLDFGLAKAFAGDPSPNADPSFSPTMAAGATAAGMILGTAAYMSPEQARGKPIDTRADVWAFGCVLFEMLTARKAFPGETVTDILAAVVRAEPDWKGLPPTTPVALRSLLRRCLHKDPTRRLHHVADARIEIEDLAGERATATSDNLAPHQQSRWALAAPWAVAAILAIALLALFAAPRREAVPAGSMTRLELSLPAGVELAAGAAGTLAISPDGRRVAFVGVGSGMRRVYLRNLDQLETQPVGGTQGTMVCFFSPDGATLGVVINNGGVKKVSLTDGLVVAAASGADILGGAAWTSDNRIVYVHSGALWEVPAGGGTAKQLTTLDDKRRETTHVSPVALPGGNGLLFMATTEGGNSDIDALDLATHERRTIVQHAMSPMYARSGHVAFVRDGELLAAPFDAKRLTLTGPLIHLAEKLPAGRYSPAAVSEAGTFVYGTSLGASRLVWVSRSGVEQPVSDAARGYDSVRISPDGRYLAMRVDASLWTQDLARNTLARVINAEGALLAYPIWSTDGKRLVFYTGQDIRWVSADGIGPSMKVAGTSVNDFPTSISPDGRTLAFLHFASDTSGDVYVTPLDGSSAPQALLKTAAYEGGARLSPDGGWMAYVSYESGQAQVYVRPFPGLERKWQVSTQGGTHPAWSRTGKELFYREGDKFMAVDFVSGAEPGLSQPKLLFQQHYAFGSSISIANYDVAPDGQRFIMIKESPGAGHLDVVLNWFEGLNRRGSR